MKREMKERENIQNKDLAISLGITFSEGFMQKLYLHFNGRITVHRTCDKEK